MVSGVGLALEVQGRVKITEKITPKLDQVSK